jgi:hypothetical protein
MGCSDPRHLIDDLKCTMDFPYLCGVGLAESRRDASWAHLVTDRRESGFGKGSEQVPGKRLELRQSVVQNQARGSSLCWFIRRSALEGIRERHGTGKV